MSADRRGAAFWAAAVLLLGCGSDGVIDLSPMGADGGQPDASTEAAAETGPGCSNDGECAPPLAHCEPGKGVCVECLTNTNCEEGVCEPSSNACVACTGNQDCEEQMICDTSQWRCVECIDNGACTEAGTACDLVRGVCAEKCGSNGDCTEEDKPQCLLPSGFCVQCLIPSDCESGESCDPTTHQCD
jgi:hypothetical protein